MDEAKILLIDIETAPNLVYTWGVYEQNVAYNQIVREGYILCYAYKWLHERQVKSDSIHDYKTFKKDPHNDFKIMESAWKLLDKADIVIAHNGNKFDIKWLNSRFLKHGMFPPSHYKKIDTLSATKAIFRHNTNKLNDLSLRYNLGKKVDTGGFELWTGCMNSHKPSFRKMVKYCKHDVTLLEKWYLKIRPWIQNHPNLNIYTNLSDKCPTCMSEDIVKNGRRFAQVGWKQTFLCNGCGKRFSDPKLNKTTNVRN